MLSGGGIFPMTTTKMMGMVIFSTKKCNQRALPYTSISILKHYVISETFMVWFLLQCWIKNTTHTCTYISTIHTFTLQHQTLICMTCDINRKDHIRVPPNTAHHAPPICIMLRTECLLYYIICEWPCFCLECCLPN